MYISPRKILLAAGAAAALSLAAPTMASAQHHHGGFHGHAGFHGHFGGRHWGGGPGITLRFGAPHAYASCWQTRRVLRHGRWHLRRVWVC
jgi:hypothetical protein